MKRCRENSEDHKISFWVKTELEGGYIGAGDGAGAVQGEARIAEARGSLTA